MANQNQFANKTTRRAFLHNATVAASAALAVPMILPGRVFGADNTVAPSNRINVALIGTGRQVFYANMPWFLWSKEVQVVAVCDVDSWRMAQAKAKVEAAYADETTSGTYKGCATHGDFRDVIARKDVDAVMISTPDHWHAYMAIAAAKAGKDIALEKPISLCVTEGRAITDAMKKYGRILRTDTEVRADARFLRLVQVVRNGLIGEVKRVLAGVPSNPPPLAEYPAPMPVPPELNYDLWQGPAAERPYTERRVHCRHGGLDYTAGKDPGWFHIQDYSLGNMLNWSGHILDIVQWALNTERTGPVEVEGKGEFPQHNLWDVLQKFMIRYRYASGIEVVYTNGQPFVRVEGTKGWIENTWFESGGFRASDEKLLKWQPGANDLKFEKISEKQDFINCVKSRRETMIPAEIGHRDASMAQIGHIAIKIGTKLKWNPETERFVGNDDADKLLTRPHRAPWTI